MKGLVIRTHVHTSHCVMCFLCICSVHTFSGISLDIEDTLWFCFVLIPLYINLSPFSWFLLRVILNVASHFLPLSCSHPFLTYCNIVIGEMRLFSFLHTLPPRTSFLRVPSCLQRQNIEPLTFASPSWSDLVGPCF